VTCRALFQQPNRHGPALTTAAMFAEALADVAPPLPLPVSPASGTAPTGGYGYPPDGGAGRYLPPTAAPRTRGRGRKPPAEHSPAARAIVSVVIVLVLVAIGMAAWSVSRSLHRSAAPAPSRPNSSSPAAVAAKVLKPVSASVYNPLGTSGDDDPGQTQNAIDGSAGTAWHTSYYFSPVFGNLKTGTGLILDMGRPVRLSQLVVRFGGTCCSHVDIGIGNSSTADQATLDTFTELQSSATAAGTTTFNVTKQATGRYVLIWITRLPPLAGSNPVRYETLIYDVIVHGFAASQPG
jgi:hypothetical protein